MSGLRAGGRDGDVSSEMLSFGLSYLPTYLPVFPQCEGEWERGGRGKEGRKGHGYLIGEGRAKKKKVIFILDLVIFPLGALARSGLLRALQQLGYLMHGSRSLLVELFWTM